MNVDVIPLDSMNLLNRPDHHWWKLAQPGDVMYTLTKEHHHAIAIIPAKPAEDLMHQSTLFAAERPVSPSPSQDSEKDWMTRVATLCSPLDIFLASTAPPGSFGKTSPAYCRATKDETLRAFWDSSRDRSSNLQQTDGEQSGLSQELDQPTESPTAFLTLNLREAPTIRGLSLKDEGVCSLSDILETGDVPQRYYLTPKACRGILRRAEKRGKELPALLKTALEAVAIGTRGQTLTQP